MTAFRATAGDPQKHHLVITGLMGVGKTTTAEALADRLDLPTRDSDRDIHRLFGCTGADIAAAFGVDRLHQIESAVLLGALATQQPSIISAAAWVVEDPVCVDALARRAVVVVLKTSADEAATRAETGAHRRPIDQAAFAALAKRRAPMFQAVADLTLDASATTSSLVTDIERFVDRDRPSGQSDSTAASTSERN